MSTIHLITSTLIPESAVNSCGTILTSNTTQIQEKDSTEDVRKSWFVNSGNNNEQVISLSTTDAGAIGVDVLQVSEDTDAVLRVNTISSDTSKTTVTAATTESNARSVIFSSEGISFTNDEYGCLYFGSNKDFRILYLSNPDRIGIQAWSNVYSEYITKFEINT